MTVQPNHLQFRDGATAKGLPDPVESRDATPKAWVEDLIKNTAAPKPADGVVLATQAWVKEHAAPAIDGDIATEQWVEQQIQGLSKVGPGDQPDTPPEPPPPAETKVRLIGDDYAIATEDNGAVLICVKPLRLTFPDDFTDGFIVNVRLAFGQTGGATGVFLHTTATFNPPIPERTITVNGGSLSFIFKRPEGDLIPTAQWFVSGSLLLQELPPRPLPGEIKTVMFKPDVTNGLYEDAWGNVWYVPDGSSIGNGNSGADVADDDLRALYVILSDTNGTKIQNGSGDPSADFDAGKVLDVETWNESLLLTGTDPGTNAGHLVGKDADDGDAWSVTISRTINPDDWETRHYVRHVHILVSTGVRRYVTENPFSLSEKVRRIR